LKSKRNNTEKAKSSIFHQINLDCGQVVKSDLEPAGIEGGSYHSTHTHLEINKRRFQTDLFFFPPSPAQFDPARNFPEESTNTNTLSCSLVNLPLVRHYEFSHLDLRLKSLSPLPELHPLWWIGVLFFPSHAYCSIRTQLPCHGNRLLFRAYPSTRTQPLPSHQNRFIRRTSST
jgi:hypothetical protein